MGDLSTISFQKNPVDTFMNQSHNNDDTQNNKVGFKTVPTI